MLIDLSLPLTINPLEYPTTLAIVLETHNRSDCGVFAGKNGDLAEHEEGRAVPVIHDDGSGLETFLLDRERGTRGQMSRRWHYAAIGWEAGVYIEHPYVYTLALHEYEGKDNDGREVFFWEVTVLSNDHPLFTLALHDYEPGALGRGVASPLERKPR